LVALAIERRQAVAGELRRFLEHRVDQIVGRMLVTRQRGHLAEARDFAQRETHVGERGGVGHRLLRAALCRARSRSATRSGNLAAMTDTILLAIDGPRATITL